jgi:hypothetical protein
VCARAEEERREHKTGLDAPQQFLGQNPYPRQAVGGSSRGQIMQCAGPRIPSSACLEDAPPRAPEYVVVVRYLTGNVTELLLFYCASPLSLTARRR